MTDPIDDRLRESLAAMSKPVDGEPVLARRALDQIDREHSSVRSHEPRLRDRSINWHARIPNALLGAMIALLLLVTAIAVFVPNRGRARSVAIEESTPEERVQSAIDAASEELGTEVLASKALPSDPVPVQAIASPSPSLEMARSAGRASDAGASSELSDAAPIAAAARILVRTGSCQIEVADLDGARVRLADMLSADFGEYVQDTALALDRFRPAATLTVRIAPERFERFTADLERLGTIRSLEASATDQTDQLVDLDARLRNERQLEAEVRDLLGARADADLEDILAVRTQLGEIRQTIERLEAQRSNLLARALLATMRITLIGPVPERTAPAASTFGDRLGEAVSDGWRTCTRSALWLTELFVSGLLWWTIFGVAVWVLIARCRRSRAWR